MTLRTGMGGGGGGEGGSDGVGGGGMMGGGGEGGRVVGAWRKRKSGRWYVEGGVTGIETFIETGDCLRVSQRGQRGVIGLVGG